MLHYYKLFVKTTHIYVFVVLFLPKKIKDYFYLLISLFSLGMVIAGLGGAIWYIRWQDYHLFISVDLFTHFTMALFGIYLIISKNVDFTFKNCLKSSAIIYVVVFLMITLNLIFNTSLLHFLDWHLMANIIFISTLLYLTHIYLLLSIF